MGAKGSKPASNTTTLPAANTTTTIAAGTEKKETTKPDNTVAATASNNNNINNNSNDNSSKSDKSKLTIVREASVADEQRVPQDAIIVSIIKKYVYYIIATFTFSYPWMY